VLLSEYLDVRNTRSSRQQAPSDFDEPTMDIAQYFGKKKPGRAKKVNTYCEIFNYGFVQLSPYQLLSCVNSL
jgi:hypothetical protein